MKLRARRGKWNGGVAPYGREVVDGQLRIVPEEAALLQRMRLLLKEKRSWRGVTITLNREGKRTRGWAAVEREGRVVRKGKPPAEWAPGTVRRVMLQPINAGDLVYNRRKAKGRTSTPRPAEEHIVVEDFTEPIFTRDEMDELLRIAAEIEGEPPARTGSEHVLSGLVYCRCGSRMHAVKNYITTKRHGRYPLTYFRCRRASHAGTCGMRQVPEAALAPLLSLELGVLALDRGRLRGLAEAARTSLRAGVEPLLERRSALTREVGRLESRTEALLELAEDRLICKREFAARKARLEEERTAASRELAAVEAELAARAEPADDLEVTLASLRRLSDVFDELEEVHERRRLLGCCVSRVVVGEASVEVHASRYPGIIVRRESSDTEVAD